MAQTFIVPILAQRQAEMDLVKKRPEIQAGIRLFDSHLDKFAALNKSVLAKVGPYATPDDIALAQMQMQKHEIPEEDRQRILSVLGAWAQAAREQNPNYDINEDPDYKRIVDGIGVGAGAGYFTEGPAQEAEFGTPVGRALYQGGKAFESSLAAAGNAVMDVGLSAVATLSDDPYYQDLLKNYRAEAYAEPFVDRNGKLVDRAPRSQSSTSLANVMLKLGSNATVDDIRKYAVRVAETDDIMRAQKTGELESYGTAITIGLGSLAGFIATGGGKAIGAGAQLITRGKMGAALLLGAKPGTRLYRAAEFFRSGLGQGIGLGVYESTLYGRMDGYGRAFAHALPMGLAFAAAGRMGKAAERLLATRKSMPRFVQRTIAGGIEGLALTPASALELESSLWRFMRDPSADTSNALAKEVLANVVSFGIYKGMTGRSPFEARVEQLAREAQQPAPEAKPLLLPERAESLVRAEEARQRRRERAERIAAEGKAAEAEMAGRAREAAEREARRRVVDYDKLTEPERRRVEGERRAGRSKSFNQRMKQVMELTDPLERTDFMELPEDVRRRITEAPDASQRKLIWFQHFTQGSGERRQGERRAQAPEVRPGRPLSPAGAKQVREALRGMPGAERLAEVIGTEPRVYTKGELDQITNAIRHRLTRLQNEHLRHQLREKEPWHRGVRKDVFKGSTIRERVRKMRELREALRRLQEVPAQVRRERGPEPVQFTPRSREAMDRLLGADVAASVSEPHLGAQRADVAKKLYEEIQRLRSVVQAGKLAGNQRGTKRAAKAQQDIRSLLAALRAVQAGTEAKVVEDAGLKDEPGLPDVPAIGGGGTLTLGQLVGAARRGEFDPTKPQPVRSQEPPVERPEEAAETFEEMILRADREGEVKPGTHEEMLVDRVEAQRAAEDADAILQLGKGDVPGPRMGQPKSLRLVPQNVMLPVTTREVPDTRMSDAIAALEGRPEDPVQLRIRPGIRIEGERISEGVRAWYQPSQHQARLRQPNAIIEASHEQAHAMDNRLQARGEWRPNGTTEIDDVLYRELAEAASTYPGIKDAYEKTKIIKDVLESGMLPDGTPLDANTIAKLEAAQVKLKNFVQSEGFAEFWSRWRLEDPELQDEVPNLYRFMVSDLMGRESTQGFWNQLEYSRQVLANYRDIGAERRVEMGRVMEGAKPTEVEAEFQGSRVRRMWSTFRDAMLDDLAKAKEAWNRWRKASEMGVEKPLDIPITMDPLRLLEAQRMTGYQMAQRAVHEGTFDLFGNPTGEGLVPIIEAVGKDVPKAERNDEYRRFWNFFVALRVQSLVEFPRRKAYEEAYERAFKAAEKAGADPTEAHEIGKQAGEQARELAEVPETGFSEADANFVVEKYDATSKGEKWREIAGRVREWSLRVIDYGVEAGSIKESDRENIANAYDVYLPFKRVIRSAQGERVEAVKPGVGVGERGKALKGFKGSGWEIEDPLRVLRDQAYDVIQKAQHHMVTQAIYLNNRILNPRLIANKQAPMGSFATQVARDAEPRTVFVDQMAKEIYKKAKERGEVMDDPDAREEFMAEARKVAGDMLRLFGDESTAIQFWFPMTAHVGAEPIIPFRPNVPEGYMDELNLTANERRRLNAEKGKVIWFEIDPTIFNALMTIDAPRSLIDNAPDIVNSVIVGPSKLVRAGATVLSPAFAARNIARDLITATVFKRGEEHYNMFNAMADAVRAARAQHRGTQDYLRYANVGLEGASIYGTEFQRDFHRSANEFAKAFKKLHQRVGQFLSKPESWHRFTEFVDVERNVREAGGTRIDALYEAMLAAKEITTNFTRAGHVARAINQLVPYYAPNLAGKRKLYRVMTGAEGKAAQAAFFQRAFANIGGMSLAVYAWNALFGEDDWREDLPQWQRENYWNLKLHGTDEILKIPKPFELGQIFGTSIEGVLDALRYERGGETARRSFLSFLEEQRDAVTNAYKIAAIMPFIEVIANHSFFKERELVPEWMEKSRLPEDQYTRYTTETAKALGSFFGVSPIKVEAILSGYTGGLALAIARSAEGAFGALTRGEFATGLLPRSFFSREHELGAYGDAIYNWSDQLGRLAGSGEITPMQAALRPRVEKLKRQISTIRRNTPDRAEADRRIYALAKPIIDQLGGLEP